MENKLIDPQAAYEKLTTIENALKRGAQDAKMSWASLEEQVGKAKEEYFIAKGKSEQMTNSLTDITNLVETSNAAHDKAVDALNADITDLTNNYESKLASLKVNHDSKLNKLRSAHVQELNKAQEEYYTKGHTEAEEEIKRVYKLTKKKTVKKPKLKKPDSVADGIVKARAKKKLAKKS